MGGYTSAEYNVRKYNKYSCNRSGICLVLKNFGGVGEINLCTGGVLYRRVEQGANLSHNLKGLVIICDVLQTLDLVVSEHAQLSIAVEKPMKGWGNHDVGEDHDKNMRKKPSGRTISGERIGQRQNKTENITLDYQL